MHIIYTSLITFDWKKKTDMAAAHLYLDCFSISPQYTSSGMERWLPRHRVQLKNKIDWLKSIGESKEKHSGLHQTDSIFGDRHIVTVLGLDNLIIARLLYMAEIAKVFYIFLIFLCPISSCFMRSKLSFVYSSQQYWVSQRVERYCIVIEIQ